jgi:Uma2 family endonuclease
VVIRTSSSRRLVPGTKGWSVHDLDDPEIEQQWEESHFEIMEGVLTEMPPAYFDGGVALHRLVSLLQRYFDVNKQKGDFAFEVDLILSERRVLKPDVVFLTADDERRQKQANAQRGKRKMTYGRLLLQPTLAIESVSLGHEERDRVVKRAWYAEFGIRNYWLLTAHKKALECLILDRHSYRIDQTGRKNDQLQPSAFPGLTINLGDLWLD